MCDLRSKFKEDRTKTAVAVQDDRYSVQTDTHTHTHTETYTRVTLYLSSAMHCIGQIIAVYSAEWKVLIE